VICVCTVKKVMILRIVELDEYAKKGRLNPHFEVA